MMFIGFAESCQERGNQFNQKMGKKCQDFQKHCKKNITSTYFFGKLLVPMNSMWFLLSKYVFKIFLCPLYKHWFDVKKDIHIFSICNFNTILLRK